MKKLAMFLVIVILLIGAGGCEKQVCYRCITFCTTGNSIGSAVTIICERGMTEQEAVEFFKDQLGEKDCTSVKCFEE